MVDNSAPAAPVPAPTPAPSMVPAAAAAGVAVAEVLVPGLMPFAPLLSLALAYIRGHFDSGATDFPPEADIMAAVQSNYLALQSTWANWKPSGDGTLPAGTTGS